MADTAQKFLIIDLSRTRVSDLVVFWRPNKASYTVNFDEAGLYSEEEATHIASNRDKENIAIPVDAVPATALVRVLTESGLKRAREIAASMGGVHA